MRAGSHAGGCRSRSLYGRWLGAPRRPSAYCCRLCPPSCQPVHVGGAPASQRYINQVRGSARPRPTRQVVGAPVRPSRAPDRASPPQSVHQDTRTRRRACAFCRALLSPGMAC
eukprot:scaffold1760_cov109-Isochrysis_galbana.AAC.5